MTNEQRQRLADWITWYRENRPRHDGSSDVMRTLKFQSKAIEGLYSTLLVIVESERGGLVVLPSLEQR
jgi:hypothetical protein